MPVIDWTQNQAFLVIESSNNTTEIQRFGDYFKNTYSNK
jgi:hypothetical protein